MMRGSAWLRSAIILCCVLIVVQVASAAITDGLVAYYSMNTGLIADDTGQGHVFYNNGTTVTAGGNNGTYGLLFNRTKQSYLKVGNPFNPTAQNWSISLFVNSTWPDPSEYFCLIGWDRPSYQPFQIGTIGSNLYKLYVSSTSLSWNVVNGENLFTVLPNVWQHLIFTYNGTNYVVYRNGSQVYNKASATYPFTSTVNITFGICQQDTSVTNNMTLDEIGIWNRTLTAAEANQIWNVTLYSNAYVFNFVNQTPSDVTSTNLYGSHLNITYDMEPPMDVGWPQLNASILNGTIYVNGSAQSGYHLFSYLTKVGGFYTWSLDDNDAYPATYNLNNSVMEATPHAVKVLTATSSYEKIQFLNVTNSSPNNYIEIMLNATAASSIFYCNSTYASGAPGGNANCFQIASFTGTGWNETNTTPLGSAYNIFSVPIITGSVGTVHVTPTSYFLVRGSTLVNLGYAPVPGRFGMWESSTNNGNTWGDSSALGTPDMHLHQFGNSSSIAYQACESRGSVINCSSIREDNLDFNPLNPTAPQILTPVENQSVQHILNISWLPSIPFNASIGIANYTIQLLNASGGVDGVVAVLGNVTSTLWNTYAYGLLLPGKFSVRVIVIDTLGQNASSDSSVFNITANGELSLTAHDTLLNASVAAFSVQAQNTTLNFSMTNSTANGSLTIDIVQGYNYTMTITIPGYRLFHAEVLAANDSTQYQFQVYNYSVPGFSPPTPANNSHVNTYAIIQVNCTAGNVSLYLDTDNPPSTLVMADSQTGQYNATLILEVRYYYLASCGDQEGISSENSSTYFILNDATFPILTAEPSNFFYTDNSSVFALPDQADGTLRFTLSDTYIFGWNASITEPDGSQRVAEEHIGLLTSIENITIPVHLLQFGRHNVTLWASDDHTEATIAAYRVSVSTETPAVIGEGGGVLEAAVRSVVARDVFQAEGDGETLAFETEVNSISVKALGSNMAEYGGGIREGGLIGDIGVELPVGPVPSVEVHMMSERKKDRYDFSFSSVEGATSDAFLLSCDHTLTYRGGLYPFPSFVCADGLRGNWIDFNSPDAASYAVDDNGDGTFTITVEKVDPAATTVQFQSVGGLNQIRRDYFFITYDNPFVTMCRNLTSPGMNYTLTADVGTPNVCLNVTASNILVDCDGFQPQAVIDEVYLNAHLHNIEVKNCNFQVGDVGIEGGNETANLSDISIHNNHFLDNGPRGIHLGAVNRLNLSDNVLTGIGAGVACAELSGNNMNITGNEFVCYAQTLILSDTPTYDALYNVSVSNNYFYINAPIVDNQAGAYSISLNGTVHHGIPIFGGGKYLGGNFYADFNGTGYSELCMDVTHTGLCPMPFFLAFDIVDYYPLVLYNATSTEIECTHADDLDSHSQAQFLCSMNNVTGQNFTCFGITKNPDDGSVLDIMPRHGPLEDTALANLSTVKGYEAEPKGESQQYVAVTFSDKRLKADTLTGFEVKCISQNATVLQTETEVVLHNSVVNGPAEFALSLKDNAGYVIGFYAGVVILLLIIAIIVKRRFT